MPITRPVLHHNSRCHRETRGFPHLSRERIGQTVEVGSGSSAPAWRQCARELHSGRRHRHQGDREVLASRSAIRRRAAISRLPAPAVRRWPGVPELDARRRGVPYGRRRLRGRSDHPQLTTKMALRCSPRPEGPLPPLSSKPSSTRWRGQFFMSSVSVCRVARHRSARRLILPGRAALSFRSTVRAY